MDGRSRNGRPQTTSVFSPLARFASHCWLDERRTATSSCSSKSILRASTRPAQPATQVLAARRPMSRASRQRQADSAIHSTKCCTAPVDSVAARCQCPLDDAVPPTLCRHRLLAVAHHSDGPGARSLRSQEIPTCCTQRHARPHSSVANKPNGTPLRRDFRPAPNSTRAYIRESPRELDVRQ